MNSHKAAKAKGFGKSKWKNTQQFGLRTDKSSVHQGDTNQKSSQHIAEITSICQSIDHITAENKNQPQALEKFIKLVNQGNLEQLTAYFARYGIDPEFVIHNLDSLIAEEFNNLST